MKGSLPEPSTVLSLRLIISNLVHGSDYLQFCNVLGKEVYQKLSRYSFRGLKTQEAKITSAPVPSFKGKEMASKRNMMLTSYILTH